MRLHDVWGSRAEDRCAPEGCTHSRRPEAASTSMAPLPEGAGSATGGWHTGGGCGSTWTVHEHSRVVHPDDGGQFGSCKQAPAHQVCKGFTSQVEMS
jgi:hypothetical protein